MVPHALIDVYGSETNGLITSLTQLVSYIVLVEAGISAAAVFALYKPLSEGDVEGISRIVTAAKRFYYRSGLIFVGLALVLAFVYPRMIDCEGYDHIQVAIIVFALSATGFLDFRFGEVSRSSYCQPKELGHTNCYDNLSGTLYGHNYDDGILADLCGGDACRCCGSDSAARHDSCVLYPSLFPGD